MNFSDYQFAAILLPAEPRFAFLYRATVNTGVARQGESLGQLNDMWPATGQLSKQIQL